MCRVCRTVRGNTLHPLRVKLLVGACERGHPRTLANSTIKKSGYIGCRLCNGISRIKVLRIVTDGVLVREITVNSSNLKQYHKLTVDQLQAKIDEQNGKCKICEKSLSEIAVDHDHLCCSNRRSTCGKCFRGVLCRCCNWGLGHFFDEPAFLRQAAIYLERAKAKLSSNHATESSQHM